MNENENQNPDEAPLVPPAVSQAASQLGKRGRGRPKTITEADRQRRSEQMQQINEARRTVKVVGKVVAGPAFEASKRIQPVTNPALVRQIEQASKNPPPWPDDGKKRVRVTGKVVGQ